MRSITLLPRSARVWFAAHEQRIAYALIAAAMFVFISATAFAGVTLHRAVLIERDALRIQVLGASVFQLGEVRSRAEIAGSFTPRLAAERKKAVEDMSAAFQAVSTNDAPEGARLEPSYEALVVVALRAYGYLAVGKPIPADLQRQIELRLLKFESAVRVESQRLTNESNVQNPRARVALILAAAAAGIAVALLVWQFLIQRRAGRIDRDIARRSEELVRLRDEFVASVSHELRTPLTSILGYLELVTENESGSLGESEAAFLEVIERNAERLLHLVSDLLLVAEADGGMLNLTLRDVEIGTIASASVEAAKPAAVSKGIELTLNDGTPAHVVGDAMRLGQMMDNLISNAIKFTPKGGAVTVGTGSSGGKVTFEVTDTGSGISSRDQQQVFNRFFRSHDAHVQTVPGTGLGLTITKAIVDAHHGTIEMQSTLGEGTTVKITLPATG